MTPSPVPVRGADRPAIKSWLAWSPPVIVVTRCSRPMTNLLTSGGNRRHRRTPVMFVSVGSTNVSRIATIFVRSSPSAAVFASGVKFAYVQMGEPGALSSAVTASISSQPVTKPFTYPTPISAHGRTVAAEAICIIAIVRRSSPVQLSA